MAFRASDSVVSIELRGAKRSLYIRLQRTPTRKICRMAKGSALVFLMCSHIDLKCFLLIVGPLPPRSPMLRKHPCAQLAIWSVYIAILHHAHAAKCEWTKKCVQDGNRETLTGKALIRGMPLIESKSSSVSVRVFVLDPNLRVSRSSLSLDKSS